MKKKPLIIWGATGHARVLREFVGEEFELVALFDNDAARESPFPGVPIHHGKEGFARWRSQTAGDAIAFLVAIGGAKGEDRVGLQRFLEQGGLVAHTAIHPTAFVAADASLGPGCHVLAHACVGAAAELAAGCIVNTGAIVEHECRLGEGVHVGPGATLAGCVSVGAHALVGAGAVVLPRTTIGARAVVGAGAVVTKDVAPGAVVAGNPAAPLRKADGERRG